MSAPTGHEAGPAHHPRPPSDHVALWLVVVVVLTVVVVAGLLLVAHVVQHLLAGEDPGSDGQAVLVLPVFVIGWIFSIVQYRRAKAARAMLDARPR